MADEEERPASRERVRDEPREDRDRDPPPRSREREERVREDSPRRDDDRREDRRARSPSRSRSRSPADRLPERPIYAGNYEYDMPETEIKRIFEEYGDVERIDMKTFCFIYMLSEKAADRAIRKLHGRQVGRRLRPLHVQYAKTKDADRKRISRPSTTLFVVNFDVGRIRERDIERHFEAYGKIKRVEIKKSYAFVQYENLEDAEYAMKRTHLSNLDGRTVTVEYVQNEDPNAARERGPGEGGGRGGDRDRDDFGGRGGGRGGYDRDGDAGGRRRASPSPQRRRSPSRSPARRNRGRSYSR